MKYRALYRRFGRVKRRRVAVPLFDFSDLSGASTPTSLDDLLAANREAQLDPAEIRALEAAPVGGVVHLGIGGGYVIVRRVR